MKKIPPLNDEQFEAVVEAAEERIEDMKKREKTENKRLDEEVAKIDEMTRPDSDATDEEIQKMRKRVKHRRSVIRKAKDRKFALKDFLKKADHAEEVDYDEVREEVQLG